MVIIQASTCCQHKQFNVLDPISHAAIRNSCIVIASISFHRKSANTGNRRYFPSQWLLYRLILAANTIFSWLAVVVAKMRYSSLTMDNIDFQLLPIHIFFRAGCFTSSSNMCISFLSLRYSTREETLPCFLASSQSTHFTSYTRHW